MMARSARDAPTLKLRIILYQCKYNFSYVVGGCLVAFGRWREARDTAGRPGWRWEWARLSDCPILGSLGARGEGTGRRHHSKHDSFQKKLGDSVCEPFGSLEVDGMTDAFCHYHRDICSRGA